MSLPLRLLLPTLLLSWSACSNPEQDRLERTTRAHYDVKTGQLQELTYDADKDGRIDTWTEMKGSRPLRARIDRDHDGRMDRWEYYGDRGEVRKIGFSRRNDGTADAWAYPGPDGRVERVEVSSRADENRIDRWERYGGTTVNREGMGELLAAEEDTTGDARPDKWETYEGGALKTAAFDEDGDGRADRRLTYDGGELVLVESSPDASGAFARKVRVE